MQGNRVSPATLCSSNASYGPSIPWDINATEDSQPSQASLFSSDPPSSIELFSQPPTSQFYPAPPHTSRHHSSQHHSSQQHLSQQQHSQQHSSQQYSSQQHPSQPYSSKYHSSQLHSSQQQPLQSLLSAQNRGQDSQSLGVPPGRKYYMKYLSTVPVGQTGSQEADSEVGTTPLRLGGKTLEVRCGRTTFDAWKRNQYNKLKEKNIIDDVVQSTKDISKELSLSLESLRAEVKEAIHPTRSQEQEGSGVSGMQWKSAVMQLLQGQADMQLCLTKVQKQHVQLQEMMETILKQLQSLEASNLAVQQQQQKAQQIPSISTLSETLETSLSKQNSKLDQLLERVENASCTKGASREGKEWTGSERFSCVSRELHQHATKDCLPISSASAVPLQLVVQTVPTLDDALSNDQSIELGSIYNPIPEVSSKQTCGKREIPAGSNAVKNKADLFSDIANDASSVDLKALSVTPAANPHLKSQSQGSSLAGYDIDLSHQSPSLCSQIIAQHLEQQHASRDSHPVSTASAEEEANCSFQEGSGTVSRKLKSSQSSGGAWHCSGGSTTGGGRSTPSRLERLRGKRTATPQLSSGKRMRSGPARLPHTPVGPVTGKLGRRGRGKRGQSDVGSHTAISQRRSSRVKRQAVGGNIVGARNATSGVDDLTLETTPIEGPDQSREGDVAGKSESPLSVLNDLLFEPAPSDPLPTTATGPPTDSATVDSTATMAQSTPATAASTLLQGGTKFQRSCEAARRRMAATSRSLMPSTVSDSILKEISASFVRQQQHGSQLNQSP